MAMALDETTPGSPQNALFLAQACSLAYCDEPEAAKGFKKLLGLDARLISAGNTQVYVAQNDKAIVVAFRGSQAPTSPGWLQGLAADQCEQLPDHSRGTNRHRFRRGRGGRPVSPGIHGGSGRDLGAAFESRHGGDGVWGEAALDHRS